MEPIEFLRILRRRWRVILACALVLLTVAMFANPSSGSSRVHRTFKAQSVLLANASKHLNTSNLSQDALLLTIGIVPSRVAQQLNFTGNPLRLVDEVKQTIDAKVGLITISSVQPTAARALALVNTFAEQLVHYLAQVSQETFTSNVTQAYGRIQLLQKQLVPIDLKLRVAPTDANLLTQQNGLKSALAVAQKTYGKFVSAGVNATPFKLIESNAVRPVKTGFSITSFGSRSTRGILALLIGLLLGAGLSLLLDRFDVRVRTKEDAEEAFGLPVVSEVPALWYPTRRRREIITAVQPISPYAEVHRILRHSLLFAHMSPFSTADHGSNGNGNGKANGNGNGNGNGHTNGHGSPNGNGKGRQVIVVTSAGSAEGKTTTVANLAASFAESGQSVLVMSCDFHGPRIQEMLGATDAPGIANVLHGGATAPTLAEVTVETSIPGVWLAPSGDGIDNPPELASSVGQLMAEARRLADVVIIDTPALLSVSAASELLPAADVAVIVARSSRATREAAARVNERLGLLEANVLGVVLVGPQIPSVSREYSGYSRPPGGWRKRRQLLRKRDIQIGTRAETLEPTRAVPAEPPGRAATAVAAAPTPTPPPASAPAPVAAAPVPAAPPVRVSAPADAPAPTAELTVAAPAPAPAPAPSTAPAPEPTVDLTAPAPAPLPTSSPEAAVDFFAQSPAAEPEPPASAFTTEPERTFEIPRPEGLPPRPRWRRRETRRDE